MTIESRSDEVHRLESDREKLGHEPKHTKISVANESEDCND